MICEREEEGEGEGMETEEGERRGERIPRPSLVPTLSSNANSLLSEPMKLVKLNDTYHMYWKREDLCQWLQGYSGEAS